MLNETFSVIFKHRAERFFLFHPTSFMLCTFLTAKVIQVENFDFFHQQHFFSSFPNWILFYWSWNWIIKNSSSSSSEDMCWLVIVALAKSYILREAQLLLLDMTRFYTKCRESMKRISNSERRDFQKLSCSRIMYHSGLSGNVFCIPIR